MRMMEGERDVAGGRNEGDEHDGVSDRVYICGMESFVRAFVIRYLGYFFADAGNRYACFFGFFCTYKRKEKRNIYWVFLEHAPPFIYSTHTPSRDRA